MLLVFVQDAPNSFVQSPILFCKRDGSVWLIDLGLVGRKAYLGEHCEESPRLAVLVGEPSLFFPAFERGDSLWLILVVSGFSLVG